MKVTVTAAVAKACPYHDELDEGTAELTFVVTSGDAPELHQLAEDLAHDAHGRMSHEEFSRHLLATTGAERVVTRWRTADLDVVVEAP